MIISQIKILKGVPFNAEDNTVITFDNEEQQQNFFESFEYKHFEDTMFVKGFLNQKIKVDISEEEIAYCNYVMYINKDFDDHKWIYAYIKNFEYISDGCCYIEIEIDYIQTFLGDIIFTNTFIDRQMPVEDDINSPECFEPEDEITPTTYLITNSDSYKITEWSVCVCYKPNIIIENTKEFLNIGQETNGSTTFGYRDYLSDDPNLPYRQFFNTGGAIQDKYLTGCAIRIYNISNNIEVTKVVDDLWKLEILGYSILNIYMIPKNLNNYYGEENFDLVNTKNPFYTNKQIDNLYLDGAYKPVNNKCFTSPFMYLELSNFQGETKKYSYQYFLYNTVDGGPPLFRFKIIKCALGRFDAVIIPLEYKSTLRNSDETYDYGLGVGKAPECQWNQSMSNAIKDIAKTTFDVAVAVGTQGASVAEQTAKQTAKQVAKQAAKEKTQQIGNAVMAGSGVAKSIFDNTDLSSKGIEAMPVLQSFIDKLGWTFKQYVCFNLFEIDDYFSMYGYKTNLYTVPNILGNKRFNYIRMLDPKIFGDIPLNAKNIIKEKLKMGVTFWHDKNDFTYGSFRDNHANTITGKTLKNGKIFQN